MHRWWMDFGGSFETNIRRIRCSYWWYGRGIRRILGQSTPERRRRLYALQAPRVCVPVIGTGNHPLVGRSSCYNDPMTSGGITIGRPHHDGRFGNCDPTVCG